MVEISRYLRDKGFTGKIRGEEFVFDKCPFCEKPKKATMSVMTGLFYCQRASCKSKSIAPSGRGLNFYQFQKTFGDIPQFTSNEYFKTRIKATAVLPKDKLIPLNKVNLDWLMNERKLAQDILDMYNIRQRKDNEIAFPYYDNGKIIFIKYRIRDAGEQDDKCRASMGAEGGFFGKQFIDNEIDYLIITEGEIDSLSLKVYGFNNVVSVPNGASSLNWIEREWFFLHQFKTIYLCFDNDAAGQQPIESIATRLSDHICKRVFLPKKDANECLQKGMSWEDVGKLIFDESESVFESGYCKGSEDFEEAMMNYRDASIAKGISTGIPFFDEHLGGGWRPREVTIIGGYGGVGKTTLMLQLLRNLAIQKHITTMITLEMEWSDLLEWVFEQNGLTANSPKVKFDKLKEGLDKWVRVIKPSAKNNESYILSMMELSARVDGSRYFVLDNLTMMDMGQDDYDRVKQFIVDCFKFVKKYDAHMVILAHNRKRGSKETGTPTMDDIIGTGNVTRLASNVILMYFKKNGDDMPHTVFDVKKNRKFGKMGNAEFKMVDRKMFVQVDEIKSKSKTKDAKNFYEPSEKETTDEDIDKFVKEFEGEIVN